MSEPRVWQSWLKENSHKWLLYARQQTRSDADAEDVLQDALVKTWKACEGKISDETTSLVYTNIRRCAIDRGRSNSRREEREQKVAEESPQSHEAWFEFSGDEELFAEALQDALRQIPDNYREVITLKIWGELTFAQIGENLGISQNTAASRYRYGLEQLRRILETKEDIGGVIKFHDHST